MKCRYCPLVAVALLLLTPEAVLPGQNSLEAVKSLKCVFSTYATVAWQSTDARVEVKTAKLSMLFEAIDIEDGTAESIGPYGPMHIVVRYAANTLHLIHVASTSGALYVTTVFGREAGPGKRLAVHSRHEYTAVSLPGFTSRPEQYYGECDIQP